MIDVHTPHAQNEKWPSVHRREGSLSWRPKCEGLPTMLRGQPPEKDSLSYLGSVSAAAPEWRVQFVGARIEEARKVYQIPRHRVFCSQNLRKSTIAKVLRTMDMSVLLYGAETWAVTKRDVQKLRTFHMRCLQGIAGMTPWNKRRNVDIKGDRRTSYWRAAEAEKIPVAGTCTTHAEPSTAKADSKEQARRKTRPPGLEPNWGLTWLFVCVHMLWVGVKRITE